MANVTGPISTLPGSRHQFPQGTMCDDHPEVLAVARIQGETDSFGCEMADMCQACVDEMEARIEEEGPVMGCCAWCKQGPRELRETRDYDEGSCGPVYDVCSPCRQKQLAAAHEELYGTSEDRAEREWEEDEAQARHDSVVGSVVQKAPAPVVSRKSPINSWLERQRAIATPVDPAAPKPVWPFPLGYVPPGDKK